jgi:hypothetical protein
MRTSVGGEQRGPRRAWRWFVERGLECQNLDEIDGGGVSNISCDGGDAAEDQDVTDGVRLSWWGWLDG